MRDEHPRDDARGDGSPADRTDQSALSAVGTLMEERRQYETWLAALEARRAETPKHVFTRVHADYVARLESVVGRLIAHADGLRAELTSLTTRIATLDEQQHRARDERAELELRAHVGEISADGWKKAIAASDAMIVDLKAQHERAQDELRRTRELLADAERPPTPVAATASVPAPVPASAPASRAAPAPAPAPAPQQQQKTGPTFRPMAGRAPSAAAPVDDVSDVAEAGAHVPSGAPPAPPPAAAAKDVEADVGNFDELAFLQSVVEEPESPLGNPGQAAAPAAPPTNPPAPPRTIGPPPRPQPFAARGSDDKIVNRGDTAGPKIEATRGRSLAANISGNNPIVLRDKSAEAAKTLKCAECGAMNYPTEWYCERCGAELASM